MEPVSLLGAGTGATDPSQLASSKAVTGKQEFLTLLVAQLQHQDPLNPMEGADFTAQLATFSSLEQLIEVNKNLGKLSGLETSATQSQAIGMLGKQVLAEGNTITVSEGTSSDITFALDKSSSQTMVSVTDANGTLISVTDAGPFGAGQHSVPFSARDSQGNPLPDGVYIFQILATDVNGADIGVKSFSSGLVSGVKISEGATLLNVGPTEIPLSGVVEITEPKPVAGAPVP